MTVLSVLDSAGRRRSPATMPGYHAGRPPRNTGMRYPADVELAREGVPLNILQRQLGHANLGTTSSAWGAATRDGAQLMLSVEGATLVTPSLHGCSFGGDELAAQSLERPTPLRPDRTDRHAQSGRDLFVARRRVGREHPEQGLVALGQALERVP